MCVCMYTLYIYSVTILMKFKFNDALYNCNEKYETFAALIYFSSPHSLLWHSCLVKSGRRWFM